MNLTVYTHEQRPELSEQRRYKDALWPPFMQQDALSNEYWHTLNEYFPAFQLYLVDDEDKVIAMGHTLPLTWDSTIAGLPAGWRDTFVDATRGYENGIRPNTLSAIEANVRPGYQRQGLSAQVLGAMRKQAQAHGLQALIAPIRPTLKHRYPLASIDDYVTWQCDDGSPFDPWQRTHWKVGAEYLAIAPNALRAEGTVAEWESWAGMRFPESGQYIIPQALNPITIDVTKDWGLYVEPNVWMHHPITTERLTDRPLAASLRIT